MLTILRKVEKSRRTKSLNLDQWLVISTRFTFHKFFDLKDKPIRARNACQSVKVIISRSPISDC